MPGPTPEEAENAAINYSQSVSQSNIDQKTLETVSDNEYSKAFNEANRQGLSGDERNAYVKNALLPDNNSNIKAANDKREASRTDEEENQAKLAELASTDEGKAALKTKGFSDTNIDDMAMLPADPNSRKTVSGAVDNLYGPSGFETPGFAAHAPFYYQFPTLEAISEFHLRNGIGPYGARSKEEIARDAVHFQVYQTIPPAWKAEMIPGTNLIRNNIEEAKPKALGSFTIYPNNPDSFSMDHTHTYTDDNQIASIINSGLEVVSSVESIMAGATAALKSINTGEITNMAQRVNRRLDTINIYQSSAKAKITIPFVLFTRKDFLRDVFQPLMILTALSYPKRKLTGNMGTLGKNLAEEIKTAMTNMDTGHPELNKTLSAIAVTLAGYLKSAGIAFDQIEKYLASSSGFGPFRYFISQRPEYLSVRHASGLYYYPIVFIEKFSYNFKGPWYNLNGSLNKNLSENTDAYSDAFESSLNKAITSGYTDNSAVEKALADKKAYDQMTPEQQKAYFAQAWSPNAKPPSAFLPPKSQQLYEKNKLPFAYPSYAECSISIASALPSFRDDFLQMLSSSRNGGIYGQELVTLSQRETGQLQQIKKATQPKGDYRDSTGKESSVLSTSSDRMA